VIPTLNEIVIASRNRGKIYEIKEILSETISNRDLRLIDLNELADSLTIEENGKTFGENALIKAEAVNERHGLPVMADDSGLCVAHLGGRPGVRSARFAGPGATDEENNRLLLEKLRVVPWSKRGAWFTCVAVFYLGKENYHFTEGRVDGFITETPQGTGGFGYDPIFYIPRFGMTMAQLGENEKNRISHRALAFRALMEHIKTWMQGMSAGESRT
jgi:non-canonical purine NTP pyrophosphatase (RdgB/HAM1 family)